jgi:hypothetical protein
MKGGLLIFTSVTIDLFIRIYTLLFLLMMKGPAADATDAPQP